MMKLLVVVIAALAAAGCATTDGLDATEERSGFLGARVVDIEAHGNACRTIFCTGLGAQWTSEAPDVAFVKVVVFSKFVGITGAQVSVDGKIHHLRPSQLVTSFSAHGAPIRESRQTFTLPLATVRELAAAKRAWLRVQTLDGQMEDAIIDGSTDSKAYHALGRFLALVDAGK